MKKADSAGMATLRDRLRLEYFGEFELIFGNTFRIESMGQKDVCVLMKKKKNRGKIPRVS
jgi:hypothetical protein